MLGIVACGGLLGALLAPAMQRRLRPRQVLIGETWLIALVLPLLLLAHNALLLGLIVAVAGLATPVTNSIVGGYRVALPPDRLQGRHPAPPPPIPVPAGRPGPPPVRGLPADG